MSISKEKIYAHLPIVAQNIVCSIFGWKQIKLRYGGNFHDLLTWLEESQWWPSGKIKLYQEEQLEKIIRHAYYTVPFYRRVFDKYNLIPTDIRSHDDLGKLPILTKEDVRNHRDHMLSTEYSRRALVFSHTSGTSGKSLQFYLEPRAIQFRWAVWWRHKMRFGVDFNVPYATFTGLTAVPLTQNSPPYWRENWPMHQTVFTMHHIMPSKVHDIVSRLNRGGFEYYSGYPSILHALAALIQESHLEITSPPKIIFTGAENLYDDQRKIISEVFNCAVTDEYGFSEGCGNASRCQADVFHEDFEYGILECIDPMPINARKHRGRIIATGFASYAMPFIRYDIGDTGIWESVSCPCGRQSTVLTCIEGRVEDYIVTPEGHKIMRFDYLFKDSRNIMEAQVLQKELGSIHLRIVRRPSYSLTDEKVLVDEVKNRISRRLKVEFEYVTEIEREPNGKFRAVKSLLKHLSHEANFSEP
jgi:phenylacetate-CoA ligase